MNTLNLIHAEQSDLHYQVLIFPDGQPHIKLDKESISALDNGQPLRILCRIASAADLLLALFAKNALDYLEFERIELHVSYLLAARMDRVMQDGEPFSLKVVAALINNGGFRKVKLFDPHSEVSTALIGRSYPVPNHAFVRDALQHYLGRPIQSGDCLVSPDAGALKTIHKLALALGVENVVECSKERDPKTGALTAFQTAAENLSGQTCFIVDDICDGGGTFAGTARLLRERGAGKIVLIVSHGIFSKGTSIEGVDAIYTTDSYRAVEGVNCLPIERYLLAT